jgi:hypothetical protein
MPFVNTEACFALKGGTAINFFVRDFSRLSVDIDLVYLPLEDRPTTLQGIDAALQRIATKIRRALPGAQVREQRGPRDGRLGSQDAVDARGPQGLGAQRVEQGLFEELVDAVGRVDAVLWPDEHLDGRELGHAAQELLDEDRADVARPSRDEDGGSGEGVADGGLGRWFIGWFGREGGEGEAQKEERKRGGLFVLF